MRSRLTVPSLPGSGAEVRVVQGLAGVVVEEEGTPRSTGPRTRALRLRKSWAVAGRAVAGADPPAVEDRLEEEVRDPTVHCGTDACANTALLGGVREEACVRACVCACNICHVFTPDGCMRLHNLCVSLGHEGYRGDSQPMLDSSSPGGRGERPPPSSMQGMDMASLPPRKRPWHDGPGTGDPRDPREPPGGGAGAGGGPEGGGGGKRNRVLAKF